MFALLQLGSTGNPVVTLQTQLQAVLSLGPKFSVDGQFGRQTEAAVKAFQQQHQLQVDGMAGSLTTAELNRSYVALQPAVTTTTPSGASIIHTDTAVAESTNQPSLGEPTNLAVLVQQLEHALQVQVSEATHHVEQAEQRSTEVMTAVNQALTILKGVVDS
jgi:peptidoglycan hydrolase-like protein with peptidoglycan-binding domain